MRNYFEPGIEYQKTPEEKLEEVLDKNSQIDLEEAYNIIIGAKEPEQKLEELVLSLKKLDLPIDILKEKIFIEENLTIFIEENLKEIFEKNNVTENEINLLIKKIKNNSLENLSLNIYKKNGELILSKEVEIDRDNTSTILNSIKNSIKALEKAREIASSETKIETYIGLQFEEY